MDVSLQGRFLIYTPKSPGNRISRRIRDPLVRKQLIAMSKAIKVVNGCILRASAAHTQTEQLIREAKIQRAIWESLQMFVNDTEPALLMLGPDALQRVLADFATSRVGGIQVADDEREAEARNWCDLYAPELMQKIESRQVSGTRSGTGLLEVHDILGQIEEFLRPTVPLKSGGNLMIEETALGTTIDVNSGPSNSLQTVNIEAADEIARQIRLRNIGGVILIDFAGPKDKPNLARLDKRLQQAFDLDPCTVESHGPTKTGLFEVTRSRRTASLMDRIELVQGTE
jgi:Rne/Rng family ribonuclease